MKKVSFYTFGCRLNQAETASLERNFEAHGFPVVDFKQPSDLVVVNTCTVTANGDADTRRLVNRINRENPREEIALIGCQAQMQGDMMAQMPSVKWVVGNNQKMNLPELVMKHSGDETFISTEKISRESFTIPQAAVDPKRTRANLKIQDGCDFYCLFCEIPYARGRARSRVFEDLLNEAEILCDAGHKEIVLTGVNIATYLDGGKKFMDVLHALLTIDKLERLRISSIEPTTIPDEIIELMRDNSKLCNYLHIPIQSANDYILHKMNRRYDMAEYTEFIMKAYETIPNLCLGTDVIVGYPGETDERFQETYDALLELPFAYFHVFSYSERQEAKSKKVFARDNVDSKTISERSKILRELSHRKRHVFMENYIGRDMPVLFEQEKKGYWTGITENFIRVNYQSSDDLKNKIQRVKLKTIENQTVIGA
ncbi:MAG: tRNA (N(6)-L-threonylcarbamoyladenosine(37)-C(2))-methylthiotransferase MtaB [Lentisphaeria bacterium]|nr:tRNA (N(6)-L-threonylcarbamoyladenosine(37)-C(2))-methylthiotransferase MtaB [Lentisphaeria bacterium]